MQINSIGSNTCFGARLNIIGHTFDDPKLVAKLTNKAKKIGLDNDIIEIKYSTIEHKPKEYRRNQDSRLKEADIIEAVRARFIPGGSVKALGKIRDRIYADSYFDLWKQEKDVATDYINKLENII